MSDRGGAARVRCGAGGDGPPAGAGGGPVSFPLQAAPGPPRGRREVAAMEGLRAPSDEGERGMCGEGALPWGCGARGRSGSAAVLPQRRVLPWAAGALFVLLRLQLQSR